MTPAPSSAAMTLAASEGRAAALAAGESRAAQAIALSPTAETKLDQLLSYAIGAFAIAVALFLSVPLFF